MSDLAPVCPQDLQDCEWREVEHHRSAGGAETRVSICTEHPRLGEYGYRRRAGLPWVTAYTVDGVRCRGLDDAIAALNGPVIPEDFYERAAS